MQAIDEELQSKRTIEDKLGCRGIIRVPLCVSQTDSDFKEAGDSLRRAGYENGVCTIMGGQTEERATFPGTAARKLLRRPALFEPS